MKYKILFVKYKIKCLFVRQFIEDFYIIDDVSSKLN